jgi:hypothetical protein
MYKIRLSAVCAAALLASADAAELQLNKQTYEKTRDFILPSAEESAWQKIPWRGSFWEGLVDAQKSDKPILLWSYGGDPLGSC